MYVKFCLQDRRFILLRLHKDYSPNQFKERANP